MSMEKSIDNLTSAIKEYTTVLQASVELISKNNAAVDEVIADKATTAATKKAPAKKAPAKKAAPTKGPTVDDVKNITLKAVKEFDLAPKVKEIVKAYGQAKATELDPKNFAEYIGKVEELIADSGSADEDEDLI